MIYCALQGLGGWDRQKPRPLRTDGIRLETRKPFVYGLELMRRSKERRRWWESFQSIGGAKSSSIYI